MWFISVQNLRRETLGFHLKLDGSDIGDGDSQSRASESLAQSCPDTDKNSECDVSHHRSSLAESVSEEDTIHQADETMVSGGHLRFVATAMMLIHLRL